MSNTIEMVCDGQYVYEAITTPEFEHSADFFMAEAAHAIALELISSGAVLVQSEYDVARGVYRTAATVLAARRKRKLP